MTFQQLIKYWDTPRSHEAWTPEQLASERELELCSCQHRAFFHATVECLKPSADDSSLPFTDTGCPADPASIPAGLHHGFQTLLDRVEGKRPGFRLMALLHLRALWLAWQHAPLSEVREFTTQQVMQAWQGLDEEVALTRPNGTHARCCIEGLGRVLLLELAVEILREAGRPVRAILPVDSVRVGALLVNEGNGQGVPAHLVLDLVTSPGEQNLYPATAFAFVACDSGFKESMRNARTYLEETLAWPRDKSVRWRIEFQSGNDLDRGWLHRLEGPSLGGAFGLGLANMLAKQMPRMH